jgi:hypothetical protein
MIQLYKYPSIVLTKDDSTLSLVYCERTGIIVGAYSQSLNPEPFNNTKLDWQVERLKSGGWKVDEQHEETKI